MKLAPRSYRFGRRSTWIDADRVIDTDLDSGRSFREDEVVEGHFRETQTGVKMPVLGGNGTMRRAMRPDYEGSSHDD